jgi:Ca2+-binding EF-hand superfamily protein
MLNLDGDLSLTPAIEPEKRDVDITNELAKKFSTDTSDVQILMANLRVTVAQHGARGIHGLARKFKIIDDDSSGTINLAEFTKFINEHAMHWTLTQVKAIFDFFDTDKSGGISFNEFLIAFRGEINDRRKQIILLAFAVLDSDKSGLVQLNDITAKYDASKHPDVKAGKRTAESVLQEFLDTFDGNKDGEVTPLEFIKYYENVSSSIDDDDYFELMIRNAWHISGGEGWCANSSCRRVLVTHTDGRQTVEEIKNDIGIKETDIAAMTANLAAQGITDVASIELKGSTASSTEAPPAQLPPPTPEKTESKTNAPPQPPVAMPAQPFGRRGAKGGQSSIVFG